MIKKLVKTLLQTAAGTIGWQLAKRGESRLIILMYHRVLPPDDSRYSLEEPGMVVADSTFRMHMEVLREEQLPVVTVSQWVDLPPADRPPLAVAITFDDGWLDNYEFAFPVLKEFDYPATLYVVSDFLGQPAPFWPNRVLNLVLTDGSALTGYEREQFETLLGFTPQLPMSRDEAAHLISELKKRSDSEIYATLAKISSHQAGPADMMDEAQILSAMRDFKIEIGCHTRKHLRLTSALSDAQLEDEIVESKHILSRITGQQPVSFCFPNGDYSDNALLLVQQNYANAVTTKRGINHSGRGSVHELVRIGLHNDVSATPVQFKARLSTWL